MKKLTKQEKEKYGRQMTHPGFSEINQEKLKNATVLVAGIGGLGGAAVWSLAGAGIGKLILVHAGNLEQPDLNRQTLMTTEWIGKPRIDQAQKTIQNFNPMVEVETHNLWINEENFSDLMKDVDLVIDARHNFTERRIINKVCVKHNVPFIEAAMNGLDGYIFAVHGNSACLNCVYPEDQPWDPYGFSVFGAVASTVGSMAGLQAIKYLSGYDVDIFGVMTYIDLSNLISTHHYKLIRDAGCTICQ